MKYKKGQWLMRTNDGSSYFTKGKYYKISGVYNDGDIAVIDDGGDMCEYSENKISERFKPAPKTWETLEVGDVVIDGDGSELYVVEVLDNSFSYLNQYRYTSHWITFKRAEARGWKIKGAEDIEVEELTMEEVCKELGRTIKIKK